MTGLIRFNGVPHVRWNPVAFRTHTSDVDRVLQTLASEVLGGATAPASELRADVRETPAAYIVKLDVPGVAKEDITVDVDEKSVRIEASFKRTEVEGGETVVLSERINGALTRNFRLPQPVDAEQASAHHEHGVLTLTLPKKNAATQKRLAIN